MSVDFDWEDEENPPTELAEELDEAGLELGDLGDDDVWGATPDDEL